MGCFLFKMFTNTCQRKSGEGFPKKKAYIVETCTPWFKSMESPPKIELPRKPQSNINKHTAS